VQLFLELEQPSLVLVLAFLLQLEQLLQEPQQVLQRQLQGQPLEQPQQPRPPLAELPQQQVEPPQPLAHHKQKSQVQMIKIAYF